MHRNKVVKKWFLIGTAVCLLSFCGCSKEQELLLETRSLHQEEVPEQTEQSSVAEREDSELYIYICGEVKKPGVYAMKPGNRVYQLIEKAGGLTEKAEARSVNQAELLEDGVMIYVPAKGEISVQESSGAGQREEDGKVNLNTATAEQLMSLNGIGEGKAESIIAYREEQGRFNSIEEIMNVEGIKEGTYNKIKDSITV